VSLGLAELLILGFIAVVAIVVLLGAVLVTVSMVRNARNLKRRGHDPLTTPSDAYLRLMQSGALQAERPMEERLAEIDRLQANGTISAAERDAARARVLGST
jgi:hypothetical protein